MILALGSIPLHSIQKCVHVQLLSEGESSNLVIDLLQDHNGLGMYTEMGLMGKKQPQPGQKKGIRGTEWSQTV